MSPAYTPGRDGRFDYATDAIDHLEQRQCRFGCRHAINPEPGQPGGSCLVLAHIAAEEPLEGVLGDGPAVIDLGADGIRCTRQERTR